MGSEGPPKVEATLRRDGGRVCGPPGVPGGLQLGPGAAGRGPLSHGEHAKARWHAKSMHVSWHLFMVLKHAWLLVIALMLTPRRQF